MTTWQFFCILYAVGAITIGLGMGWTSILVMDDGIRMKRLVEGSDGKLRYERLPSILEPSVERTILFPVTEILGGFVGVSPSWIFHQVYTMGGGLRYLLLTVVFWLPRVVYLLVVWVLIGIVGILLALLCGLAESNKYIVGVIDRKSEIPNPGEGVNVL
jgi:hypothetical protein